MCENYVPYELPNLGNTSPPSIEDEFDINLNHRTRIPRCSPTYHRLSQTEIRSLEQLLREDYPDEAVTQLLTLFKKLKRASYEPQISQTYEYLVRQALECPGEIRQGGKHVEELHSDIYDIYQDLYRISQAFLRREFPSQPTIYRGLYREEYYKIVRKILCNPHEDGYLLEGKPVSSYTISQDVAMGFEKGILLEWDLIDDLVAFAMDFIRDVPRGSDPEGELHVLSGKLYVESNAFRITFSGDRSLVDTIRLMSTPSELAESAHQDIRKLLETLVDYKVEIDNTPVKTRLWRWFNYCEYENIFSSEEENLAEASVTYIVGPE
jgi:hypothetical protein